MQKLDRNYIAAGLCWAIVGMVFGAWLGATDHLKYADSHAHMNLLGFVTSILFGLVYWAYPTLAQSRAAVYQFIVYQIGAILLVLGKVLVDGGTVTPLLPIGSVVILIGTVMMLWLYLARSKSKLA
jgi:VIT1/CCC1 family predicted Fe2+/Mn2+ transporter